jgi:hypothetical protein
MADTDARPYDEAVEALRRRLNELPRFSFLLDEKGNVARVPHHTGHWIDWQSAHELFDPEAVDAAVAKMRATAAIGHRMGALERGNESGRHFALMHNGEPVAVAMASTLIRECVGGGNQHLTRANCMELSRLCAVRPGLCRVALRLWREFVFPGLGVAAAISYQDADLHNGNTYRFDGWERIGFSSSGTDKRSGRKGRRKWIWQWPPRPTAQTDIKATGAQQ